MSQTEFTLLQEQIKSLVTLMNAQFDGVHSRLDKINGSVAHHEAEINEALIERARNREEQRHHVNTLCECKVKLEKIEKSMEDLNFILKHPKLFIATLVVIVLLTLGTFIESGSNFFKNISIQPTQTEQAK